MINPSGSLADELKLTNRGLLPEVGVAEMLTWGALLGTGVGAGVGVGVGVGVAVGAGVGVGVGAGEDPSVL